jgi:hypothetical protein
MNREIYAVLDNRSPVLVLLLLRARIAGMEDQTQDSAVAKG